MIVSKRARRKGGEGKEWKGKEKGDVQKGKKRR